MINGLHSGESGGESFSPLSLLESSFSIEDIFPPLLSWKKLQVELRNAKCSSLIYRHYLLQEQYLQSARPERSSSSFFGPHSDIFGDAVPHGGAHPLSPVPLICRRPIAVIITHANTDECPSCLLFAKDLFSPPHLQELQALRDSYVTVVLHVAGERKVRDPTDHHHQRPQHEDSQGKPISSRRTWSHRGAPEDDRTNRVQKGDDWDSKMFFTELSERFPIPFPLEEDWSFALSPKIPSSKGHLFSRTFSSYSKRLAPLAQVAKQYWKKVRDHPLFRKAWKKSYASEGEYALRILFLWPHNGSIMPITNPEWSLYAAAILKEEQEETSKGTSPSSGTKKNNEKKEEQQLSSSGDASHLTKEENAFHGDDDDDQRGTSHSTSALASGVGAHLYVSATAFLKNAILAFNMVNSALVP